MEQGGILALDLSSVTGWAYGPLDWAAPEAGIWLLPKQGGEGARYAALENELIDVVDAWAPARIVCESPIPLPAMNNVTAAYQQLGLRAIVKALAWRESIPMSEVSADIVRLEILGIARGQAIKTHVLHWCRRVKRWDIDDHNAADAAMLWEWERRHIGGPPQGNIWPWAATA